MKSAFFAVAFASATLLVPSLHAQNSRVEMTLDLGGSTETVTIELNETLAPKTSENFKKLVAEGFYNGIAFHRVISDYIAQVGDPLTKDESQRALWGTGGPGYTVPAELGGKHVPGALATARLGDSVNPTKASSGSQFYICLAEIEALDGDYTIFGNVTKGLDVIQRIANVPTDDMDRPESRVEIRSMKLLAATPEPAADLTLTTPEPIPMPTPLTPELAAGVNPEMKSAATTASSEDDRPAAPTPLTSDFDTGLASDTPPATPAAGEGAPFERPTSMLGNAPLTAPGNGLGIEALPPESESFQRPVSMLGGETAPDPTYQRPTPIDTSGFGDQASTLISTATAALATTNEDGSTTTVVPTGPAPTTIATAGNPPTGTPVATPIDPNAPPAPAATPLPEPEKETRKVPETINGKPAKQGPMHKFLRRFW